MIYSVGSRGSQDSLFARVPDSWSKSCKFESWQERQQNLLLQSQLCVLTLTQCPFHSRVITVACKRPQSFCQKCRWQNIPKHAYTQTQCSLSGLCHCPGIVWDLTGNELTCNSSGNIWSQLSQLTEPLWTDPGQKSGISVHELARNELSNILPKS